MVDGDTIEATLSLGCRVYILQRIRLIGYNSPELFSGTNRVAGAAARDELSKLIPPGSKVFIATKLDKENLDRLLGTVYGQGEGDSLIDIAASMVASGHGVKA